MALLFCCPMGGCCREVALYTEQLPVIISVCDESPQSGLPAKDGLSK